MVRQESLHCIKPDKPYTSILQAKAPPLTRRLENAPNTQPSRATGQWKLVCIKSSQARSPCLHHKHRDKTADKSSTERFCKWELVFNTKEFIKYATVPRNNTFIPLISSNQASLSCSSEFSANGNTQCQHLVWIKTPTDDVLTCSDVLYCTKLLLFPQYFWWFIAYIYAKLKYKWSIESFIIGEEAFVALQTSWNKQVELLWKWLWAESGTRNHRWVTRVALEFPSG